MSDFQKVIFKGKQEISSAAADLFIKKAEESISTKGRFAVSLSGGSTPKALFALLATPAYSKQINWSKIHLFWGDERCVPPTHADSNYRMTKEALLDKVDIPDSNIHRIKGELEPRAAAEDYSVQLSAFFDNKPAVFDLCFLGMGDDGHTASIFPETKAVEVKEAEVQEVFVKKLDAHRVTVTAPVINRSTLILFLVAGAAKASALKEVFFGDYNPNIYPSQLIRAAENEVIWYLDEAAAVGLTK